MNRRIVATLTLGLLFPLLHATHSAAATESHQRIRAVAEAHALGIARSFAPSGAQVKVQAATLDPRLALPVCPVQPTAFDSPSRQHGSRLSVGVRCPSTSSGSPGWSLYVPVTVKILAHVVVLAKPVARGETLKRSELRLETRDVARLSGAYLTQIKDAEGMVLSRSVRPGMVLSTRLLALPTLVHRGQRVRIVVATAGFTVKSEGEALADASKGERVRVRNIRSQRVVEGTVDQYGQVHTGL